MANKVKAVILELLKERGEMYSLQIKGAYREKTGKVIGLGRLYPALHNLEKHSEIIGRWGEAMPERGGNRRRYYRNNKDRGQIVPVKLVKPAVNGFFVPEVG